MEVPALLIILSDLPAKFLFCAPVPLFSAGPEVLILKRRVLHKKTATMIPLNSQLRLPLVHFEFLVLLNQQKKKKKNEVTILSGIIDPHYQDKTGLL